MMTRGSGAATAAPQFTDHGCHAAAALLPQEYDEAVPPLPWQTNDDQGAHTFFVMDPSALSAPFTLFADPVSGVDEEDAEPQQFPSAELGESALR